MSARRRLGARPANFSFNSLFSLISLLSRLCYHGNCCFGAGYAPDRKSAGMKSLLTDQLDLWKTAEAQTVTGSGGSSLSGEPGVLFTESCSHSTVRGCNVILLSWIAPSLPSCDKCPGVPAFTQPLWYVNVVFVTWETWETKCLTHENTMSRWIGLPYLDEQLLSSFRKCCQYMSMFLIGQQLCYVSVP